MKRLISLLLIFLPYISCTIGLCQDPKIDVEVDGDINIIGFLQDSLVFSNSETIYPSLPEWEINRWQNFLIHMNANREVIWYALYGQQTFHNFDVVSDKEGNVYVGGLYNYDLPLDSSTSLYTTLVEYVLIKYDPNGNYVWHRNSEGTISNYEFNMDIDSSGNIYFAGLFNGQFSFRDSDTVDSPDVSTFVVKFDSSGIKPWITQIHGSSKWVFDCEAAESGDSYVVGHFSDKEPIYLGNDTLHSKSEYDGYVAKFSTEGDPIFLKQITSLGRHAIPSSITAKNNGEFTVIGEFTRGLEFSNLPPMITNTDDKRLFIVNHDSLNNERWALYTSGHIYSSQRTKIAMDTEDNIYLTGDFADNPLRINDIPVEGSDRRLIKIDPTGNIVATNYIENGADADIFIDHNDNIYLYGIFRNNIKVENQILLGDNNNYFIGKFDSDCNLIWIDSIENPFELVGSNKGVESARIKMYPNPTGGRLTIDIDFPESNDLSVKAYNITGQIVFQSHVSGNTSDIDISHLSSGIYFIIVESNRNKWIERVTKL